LSTRRNAFWRVLAIIGITGLASLAAAYWMTCEPAPSIRVSWRDGLSSSRQAELETKYLLSNGRAPHGRSIAYDLLDTRQTNVKAIVLDPDVAGTGDIDRDVYEVPFDTAYGDRWMWVAHRTPLLRNARIRWTLIITLAMMATAGLAGLSAGHRVIGGRGGLWSGGG
jgi:hypothetical protein